MKITITSKNVELTEALRNIVEKKISKLERFFEPEVEAHATLSVEKARHKIEVTIPFNNVVLRGEETNEDMYVSIDLVLDKLESQIRKQKKKLEKRVQSGSLKFQYIGNVVEDEDYKEPRIVKTKKFAFKPMSTEEAVLQMELLGHSFFVYQNAESDEVNVVYKRKDGNYGLIEPEF
jgi:putative sigma-54 modulation protein